MSSPAALRPVLVVAFTLLSFFVGTAWSQTYVNRVWHYPPDAPPYYTIEDKTYTSEITWTAAGGPYVREARVTVGPGVLLSVETGALVEFVEGMGLYIEGDIQAGGATFTRLGERYWRGIYLSPNSNASSLVGCTIRHAGGLGVCYSGCRGLGTYNGAKRFTSVYIDGCSPVITGCVIEESWSNGIEVWRGNPTLLNTRFHHMGNDGYPLVYSSTDTFPVMAGNVTSGTGYHAVLVPPGRWRTNGSWNRPGDNFPYFISGNVSVATGTVLTISAGAILKVGNGMGLYILGALVADGTAREPIVFSSADPTAVSEKWSGIYFGPQAGGSLLHFCTILHGGSWNWWTGLGNYHGAVRYTSLYFDNCSPKLACCTIGKTASGIEMYNSGAQILSSVILDCAGKGILREGGSTPSILNNTVAQNTRNGATGIASVNSSPILTNNIVAFNGTGVSQTGSGTVALANTCVYGNGTSHAGLSPGATDLSEDPLFTGSAEGDFHLTSKSPCINAGQDGMTPPVTEDRDGKARPLGNHTDIGAFEHGESETTVFEFGGAWCATGWHGLLDLNLNGEVDVEDLILLLRRWK